MEKIVKKVAYSTAFYNDLKSIYSYGLETFGEAMADIFQEQILYSTRGLSFRFHLYSECKHLETKTQIYRNIISRKISYYLQAKIGEDLSFKSSA